MRVNIVYCYLDPKDEHTDIFGGHSFIHSQEPVPACDIYAFLNISSFKGKRSGLAVKNVLIIEEPEVVEPQQYNPTAWSVFDHVFTVHSAIVEQMPPGKATYIYTWRGSSYPSIITEQLNLREAKYPIGRRRNAIVMIAGNKMSPVPSQIYSMRAEAASWFQEHGGIPFDLYGTPPFDLPNYRGTVVPGAQPRIDKLAEYRYALTFENSAHPIWGKGYHQKIPDPLEARTVPIYYGCPDIEQYVPRACFIDFRDFGLSYEKLNDFLIDLPDTLYEDYVRNIDDFVCRGGLRPWQESDLYQKIIDWAQPTNAADNFETNGEKEVVKGYIKPGDVVFDVGAHVGEWAALIPEGVELYSFEPDEAAFSVLPTLWKYKLALSDETGTKKFYKTSLSLYNLVINEPRGEEEQTAVPVLTITLDEFCAQHQVSHIDFIKIDTEGSELAVLKGARQMLEAGRIDVIQFEYGPCYPCAKATLQEVVRYLRGLGYTISRIEKGGTKEIRGIREDYHYANYLAIKGRNPKMDCVKCGKKKLAASYSKTWDLSAPPSVGLNGETNFCQCKHKDTIVVAFSKDRAMQLDALIRSFKYRCPNQYGGFDFSVLFAVSTNQHMKQYGVLADKHQDVSWILEVDFQADLLRTVEGYKYVIFLTDDTIFTRPFSLEEAQKTLADDRVIGFSFRLGANTTYCYMHDKHFQAPPGSVDPQGEFMTWDWTNADEDFGYPLELSSSMYRVGDLMFYLRQQTYNNPNTLEAWLDFSKDHLRSVPVLASYRTSVAFSNPINKVQTVFTGNRGGKKAQYSIEKLAQLFDEGWRIDLSPFEDFTSTGVHQEVNLTFKNEAGEAFVPEKELEVSICIGNWNGERTIKPCLESVFRTTEGHDVEILVWDNGSSDQSLNYLRSLDGRIRLFESPENLGGAAPKINLLPKAKAKHVVLMDNDVILTKGWLEECLFWAANIPDLGLLGPRTNYSSGRQQVTEIPVPNFNGNAAALDEFAAKWASDPTHKGQFWLLPRLVGFFTFMTRQAIDRVGNLRAFGRFCWDDDDISLRVHLAGLRVLIDNGLFIYHIGGGQGKGDPELNRLMLEAWEAFKETWDLPKEWVYGANNHIEYILSRTAFNPAKHYVPLEKGGDRYARQEEQSQEKR